VWRRVEDLGFGWISVWDHFYGATGKPDDAACLEAVSMHAALACTTSKVRCGSLVYSIGYRHPAVLAKAITSIDLLSGGRAEMGIGAGWAKVEYDAYGIEFPGAKQRLDQLEEGIQCLRTLLHDDVSEFEGKYFTLTNALNEPRPVQAKLPIWIGGGGEKRTLKMAAQYADGWNVPFIGPDVFTHKRSVLHGYCESVGRDPADIRCAVNLGIASDDDNLRHQFGAIADFVRPGVLTGTDEELLDRIGQYVDAGADQLNISLRAPFDMDLLERFSAALHLT
ncbi:MAG TPA: TIGR03560 family F420-dependent LLM class oxidoreductase, partial [Ilumatobacteraceae bacterium]|nr:TIGR03560 family F420-dependent LLM class oxidoreductase [Ilumatobacteraceae bacterium]